MALNVKMSCGVWESIQGDFILDKSLVHVLTI